LRWRARWHQQLARHGHQIEVDTNWYLRAGAERISVIRSEAVGTFFVKRDGNVMEVCYPAILRRREDKLASYGIAVIKAQHV
jgi:hypothetical protein